MKEFEKILSAAEQDHSLLVQRAAEVAAKAEVEQISIKFLKALTVTVKLGMYWYQYVDY